ncbi:MAG: hypothetical protein JST54_17440 [Deltaproteobacteria bacterium]|nr:hypothetical protein [Deltaproteobacteria bacterium]
MGHGLLACGPGGPIFVIAYLLGPILPLVVLVGLIQIAVLTVRAIVSRPRPVTTRPPRPRPRPATPTPKPKRPPRVRPEFRLSTLGTAVIARWPWFEVWADAGFLTVKPAFRSGHVIDADAIQTLVAIPYTRPAGGTWHQLVAITRSGARLACSRPMRSVAAVDALHDALAGALRLRLPGTAARRLVSASE